MVLGLEVLRPDNKMKSASGIQEALTNLFRLVVQNRIPARHAGVLAYIGQLLLNSIPRTLADEKNLSHDYWRMQHVYLPEKGVHISPIAILEAVVCLQRLREQGFFCEVEEEETQPGEDSAQCASNDSDASAAPAGRS